MTKIEWTDATWNPIVGCSVTSPGCTNCYAMKMAGRLEGMASTNASLAHYRGTTQRSKAGFVWTGKVNMAPDSILTAPLRRRKPTRYFVNSMADLFHESVPDEWIDRVFAVMALATQHTFQVLTKRSARMQDYMAGSCGRIADAVMRIRRERGIVSAIAPLPHVRPGAAWWPLPNVWLGVSVEDQARADERIPDLLATPAAVRFLSCEPLLGALDLGQLPWEKSCDCEDHAPTFDALNGSIYCAGCCEGPESVSSQIDWVIAGGESGPGARPMHPDWVRSLRDQCQSAGVPFFFKQWGEFAPGEVAGEFLNPEKAAKGVSWFDGRWDECWSEIDGHCDDEPDVYRIGKARAGRLLDGREWSEFPA